jgi:iron complex transport system ATP-binding protein
MIKLVNLSFAYENLPVLQNFNCSINRGQFVGIIGPNGAGKSTLLKLLDRIITPQSGEIRLQSKLLVTYSRNELARIIGYVQQDFYTAYDYTALEIVLMGRFPHQKSWGFDSVEDIKIALEMMNTTDCHYLKDRKFMTLSGGEKQRVILASALAQEPEILLLDEPTAALDLKHQIHIYRILKRLQTEKQLTIITVTHDINLASQYCERILIIKDGKLHSDGNVQEVLKANILQDVYEIDLKIINHPDSGLPVILPTYIQER